MESRERRNKNIEEFRSLVLWRRETSNISVSKCATLQDGSWEFADI